LGRGAATVYPRNLADSDCIVIQGSNMAECHPVAFRWPMQAKLIGAKIIHVDPRFTRTSAMADIHAPVRAGTDIAFLGGLINYVISSERWNSDPFFKEYVINYTNAATIINERFKDTEDLDGVFSGLMEYTPSGDAWPYNGFVGRYDNASWQYRRVVPPPEPRARTEQPSTTEQQGAPHAPGPPFDDLIRSLRQAPPRP
jgi:formate dehydrogenase major subunit